MRNTPEYLKANLEKFPDEPAISIKDKNGVNWDVNYTGKWKTKESRS